MTTTVYGVEGTFPDTQFAQMHADEGAVPGGHGVALGLAVTLSSGADRQVSIAPGRAVGAGVVFYENATRTLQLPANTSGKSRIDLVVAQWDWAAARAAFTAAGGIANLDAASAAAQAAGGSFQSVQGSPGTTPVAPYNLLTQVPGDKWQEVLTEQLVRNNVGTFTAGADDPVDVRRLSATTIRSKAIALPGAWAVPTASPLTVDSFAGQIFLSGRFQRTTADIAAGADPALFSGQAVIPPGFRPTRVVNALYTSDADDAPITMGKLVILTDGTMKLYQHTSTLKAGQVVKVVNQNWIGA